MPPSPNLDTRLRFNWNAAFAQDPLDSNTAYYGSQFVHVTHDKGQIWEIISPDLSTNNQDHQKADYGGLTLDVSGAEMYNSILSIAPSAINRDVVWVGTDDGQVQLTTDGGTNWSNLTKNVKGLPKESWIAQIKASSYKEGAAWMVVNNYRKGDYAPYVFKTDDFGKTWHRLANGTNVKGYALSLVQDPVESKLVFLGTENGLWISIDEGTSWQQFKNGFPSVSTMDLTIQQTESALIVGTFGRAIWILDDLLSLREIAGNRIKEQITALPMNDAVQVKGLFINPPGNIWTGFNTTFEGENRVFQKTEVPFYLSNEPDSTSVVIAEIYDAQNKLINTIKTKNLERGLNYLVWKLDEQSAALPGAWNDSESRGISVTPGLYKVVLSYNDFKDSTNVKVINDPRFDLSPEVDLKLYEFQKEVDAQVSKLARHLNDIDKKKKIVTRLEEQLKELDYSNDNTLSIAVKKIKDELNELRSKGQTPRPERQIGAWQSFEISPHSKLQDVLMVAAARTTIPSNQNGKLLQEATSLINDFEMEVKKFMDSNWNQFEQLIKSSNLNFFDKQE
jgi:hypothetical protein